MSRIEDLYSVKTADGQAKLEPPAPSRPIIELWERGGTLIFTHLRRTAGTVLESNYFVPAMLHVLRRVRQGGNVSRELEAGWARESLNCCEGGLGRFALAPATELPRVRRALRDAHLIYRHCPWGLHQHLPPARPALYVTLLRHPGERMLSWFEFCKKIPGRANAYCGEKLCVRAGGAPHGPTRCIAPSAWSARNISSLGRTYAAMAHGVSMATAFYTGREEALRALGRRHPGATDKFDVDGKFNPRRTELLLDDNYATRMLCGGAAHEQEAPIGAAQLACAQEKLGAYAFVGVLEHLADSLCVLSQLLGARMPAAAKGARVSASRVAHRAMPADFERAHGAKYSADTTLWRAATQRLDDDVGRHPACVEERRLALLRSPPPPPARGLLQRLAG